MGEGGSQVDGAISSQAHAVYIDAGGVYGKLLAGPVHYLHDFLRAPCSTWILGRHDVAVDATSLMKGANGTKAIHLFHVLAAQAGPMEEDKQGIVGILVFNGLKIEKQKKKKDKHFCIVAGEDLRHGTGGYEKEQREDCQNLFLIGVWMSICHSFLCFDV